MEKRKKEEEEKQIHLTQLNPKKEQNQQTIEAAFSEQIEYEEASSVDASPMNEAVKEGEVSEGAIPMIPPSTEIKHNEIEQDLPSELLKDVPPNKVPTDAPEQVIEEKDFVNDNLEEDAEAREAELVVTDSQAKLAAESLIGTADQLFEIGGGFFVKIKKTKAMVDFDELIRVKEGKNEPKIAALIDEKNVKNIQRIKLDEEDKAMLKPVLMEVLKNQTKKLTPEQQLMAIGISIAVKKAQLLFELRTENKLFLHQLDNRMKSYTEKYKRDEESDFVKNGESEQEQIIDNDELEVLIFEEEEKNDGKENSAKAA